MWPGAQQARWGSWWALLPTLCLCSRPSGQNVRTAQEAVQPVRHLQGGQDCRCGVVKGMVVVYVAYPAPSLGCCRLGFRRSLRPSACRRLAVVSVKWFAVISELSIVACKHTSREPFWPSSPPRSFLPIKHSCCILQTSQVTGGFSVPFCQGFSFPVFIFGVKCGPPPLSPKIHPAEKGMVDPPLPLFFVYI